MTDAIRSWPTPPDVPAQDFDDAVNDDCVCRGIFVGLLLSSILWPIFYGAYALTYWAFFGS